MELIIVAAFIMLFAASIQGITGFGRALIAAPLIALFTPADDTVVLMIISGFAGTLMMVINTHRHLQLKKMIPMVLFGIAGSTAGVRVLAVLPVKELKIIMGAFIILSAVILVAGFSIKIKKEGIAYSVAGFVGGFTNGAISFGGPPTVVFLQSQKVEKNVFRANLSFFFLIIGFVSSINIWLNGMLTGDILIQAGILTVPTILGTFLGNRMSLKFPEKIFKKIVLIILFSAGTMAIITSVIQ